VNLEVTPVYRLRQQVERQIRSAIVSKQVTDGTGCPVRRTWPNSLVCRGARYERPFDRWPPWLDCKITRRRRGSFVRKLDVQSFGHFSVTPLSSLLRWEMPTNLRWPHFVTFSKYRRRDWRPNVALMKT